MYIDLTQYSQVPVPIRYTKCSGPWALDIGTAVLVQASTARTRYSYRLVSISTWVQISAVDRHRGTHVSRTKFSTCMCY